MFLRLLIALLRFRGSFRKSRSLHPGQIHSILIVELTRLGDVVTMLPAVRLLAQHFSTARLHLLVNAQYESFLRSLGLPCVVRGIREPESVAGFLRAVMSVRQLRVELALSMSPPKRNAAVTLTSGARRKVGYLTYRHSVTPYLEVTPVEAFGCVTQGAESYGLENIEQRSLKVCRALGVSTDNAEHETRIQINRDQYETRLRQLRSNFLIPDRRYVVLHPFSGWEFRSWDLDRFNQTAQVITDRLQYDVIFLCEKSEEQKLESSKRRFGGREDVHFVASDDLLDTCVILKGASLVLGNDSGPLHLASALGARVIGLFGPASPELTAPRRAGGVFLYKKVECSPCEQCTCVRPTEPCLSLISTEEVLQGVMKQLSVVPDAEAVANA